MTKITKNSTYTLVWIRNAVLAVVISVLYYVFLILLEILMSNKVHTLFYLDILDISRSILIANINLSILVWCTSISSAVWSIAIYTTKSHTTFINFNSNIALKFWNTFFSNLCLLGAFLIAISPLFKGHHYMNHYIPILENLCFILGISLYLVSTFIFGTYVFINLMLCKNHSLTLQTKFTKYTTLTSIVTMYLATSSFCISYYSINKIEEHIPIDTSFFYELLFWAPSHIIQFLYTQIFIYLLIVLSNSINIRNDINIRPRIISNLCFILLGMNLILCLLGLGGHCFYIMDAQFKSYFTAHMKYCNYIAPILTFLLIWIKNHKTLLCDFGKYNFSKNINKYSFLLSFVLFLIVPFAPSNYYYNIMSMTVTFIYFLYIANNQRIEIFRVY